MNRNDIHLIARHSNWEKAEIEETLKTEVYAGKTAWRKFITSLTLALGIGFSVSGVLFFFAYNWDDLSNFMKFGILEGLIIIGIALVLFTKLGDLIKKEILTGSIVLVGVLLAVFGQIYQTGADGYQLFLAWTALVALWVLVSKFAPAWLIFVLLLNFTYLLYTQQTRQDFDSLVPALIMLIGNLIILITALFIRHKYSPVVVPNWFTAIISVGIAIFLSAFVSILIFDQKKDDSTFFLFVVISISALISGIIYGYKNRNGFYIALVGLASLIILVSLFFKMSHSSAMFLFVCLFIIAYVTLLILFLIKFQKKGALTHAESN